MKGVFLDYQTLDQQDLNFSALTSTLDHWELFKSTSPDELASRIQDAEIVISNKVALTASSIQKATRLRCILVAATGCDHIDLAQAKEQGIIVCNVAGYSTASVIQQTIGFLINLASRMNDYDARVKQGAWLKATQFCLQDFQTLELAGKTLGIIGYGAIGKGVATVANALGMKVLIAGKDNDPRAERIPLMTLLPQVDALSLHCPLTAQTKHLIDEAAISKMKKGAFLINVARGGLIDEYALAQALLSGHLGGAAVDVLSQEPPTLNHPFFAKPIPRLIVTPHVAWATQEARRRLLNELVENLQAFLKGLPRNRVI